MAASMLATAPRCCASSSGEMAPNRPRASTTSRMRRAISSVLRDVRIWSPSAAYCSQASAVSAASVSATASRSNWLAATRARAAATAVRFTPQRSTS